MMGEGTGQGGDSEGTGRGQGSFRSRLFHPGGFYKNYPVDTQKIQTLKKWLLLMLVQVMMQIMILLPFWGQNGTWMRWKVVR